MSTRRRLREHPVVMITAGLVVVGAVMTASQFPYAPHILVGYITYWVGALLIAKLKEDARQADPDAAGVVGGPVRRWAHRLGHVTGFSLVVGAYIVFFAAWGGMRLGTFYFALLLIVCLSELLYPLVAAVLWEPFYPRLYAAYALPVGIILYVAGLGALFRLAH